LALVWDKERPAGEIATHFSLSRPAISQHLTMLLDSGLVSVRKAGTRRYFHANRDAIAELRTGLGAFWDDRIDEVSLGMLAIPRTASRVDWWRGPVFDDVFRGLRPQMGVAYWPEFRAPWGVSFERDWAVFHIIVQGTCWLQLKGLGEPVQLSEGDFVVVTRGIYHTMRDLPSTPTVNFADLVTPAARGKVGAVRFAGEGPATRLVCGGIEDRGHPLMTCLPPLLHIKRTDNGARAWVRLTTKQILSELDSGGAGSMEVANRLVDVLFLQAVRAFFDENVETDNSGWLAAIRDEQIGRALAAIHGHPHRSWTVVSLARHVAMSRTTFAARFRELVGEPPQHYFTRLRISAAAMRLRSSRDKLGTVAADAGYRSIAAFLRSFKRHIGTTPGEYRDSRYCWPL
jgi:AraC-like DNA-binding protein